jgi:hypothetical protein
MPFLGVVYLYVNARFLNRLILLFSPTYSVQVYNQLTDDERARNEIGTDRLFVGARNPAYGSLIALWHEHGGPGALLGNFSRKRLVLCNCTVSS